MESSEFVVGSIFGAIMCGIVLGIFAAKIAIRNGQQGFAVISFIGCFAMGAMGGIGAGLPALILFGFLSWIMGGISEPSYSPARATEGNRSGWNVYGIAFGIIFGFAFIVISATAGVIIHEERRPDEPLLAASIRLWDEHVGRPMALSSEPSKRKLSEAKKRKFKSSDGRVINAHLISFDGEIVEIIREDGRPFRSSISGYSKEDQTYIRTFF